MKLHAKYQMLGLLVSDRKIFKGFSYIRPCKTCGPKGRDMFGPKSVI